MANGNWFDDWVKDVGELLGDLGEQFAAFTHRGIQVAPSNRWMRWVWLLPPTTCKICRTLHGTVFDTSDINTYPQYAGVFYLPKVHYN